MTTERMEKSSKMVDIQWSPDKDSDIPLYRQITNYFREKILKGDWIVGQKMPSQRELARLFGVNRSTIVEAMAELSSMGIIEGSFGGGTRIASDNWSFFGPGTTPNWRDYIDGGSFRANAPTVQSINKLEYEEDIVRLGTGELSPDLIPQKMMRRILKQMEGKEISLSYPEPCGLMSLRKAISKYLLTKGINASPSEILIVSGALQALQLISVCITPPRATVYVESPSYLKSLHIFQSSGTNLEGVPMDRSGMMPWMIKNDSNKYGNSILYTIPSFQNPTGNVMSATRRRELLNFGKVNRMPIIEDDVLGELWFDDPPPPSIKSMDTSGIVLYVGSASKCLAPGLRVGWMVGPESVVERMADIKMQQDYGTSTLSQMLLAEWLETDLYQQHLCELRVKMRERRDFMLKVLDEHFRDLATWEIPTGSYYVWLKVKHNVLTETIFERALREKILINPGGIYEFKQNQHIRLSYAYEPLPRMKEALLKLAQILAQMKKKPV